MTPFNAHRMYKNRVKLYLENKRISPIFFKCFRNKLPKKVGARLSTKELIIELLILSDYYNSYFAEKPHYPQCRRNARRSSFDIWQLCLFYKPKITIFKVMRTLFELVRERSTVEIRGNKYYISTNYCFSVRRRVFDFKLFDYAINDETYEDEYGLKFFCWEKIGWIL